MAETVFILAGSNVGDRERFLKEAHSRLENIPGLEIVATSSVYVSEAKDMEGENPSFLNQVIMVDFQYLANELLDGLERIELLLGRSDKGRNVPRTIDLDILLFGQQIIETDRLSIPHRELLNRPFAMVPLLQIDDTIVHPVVKRAVKEFLSEEDAQSVILLNDHVARTV
ncbi:MAG: 2-amino-4-hydroxy-6-hydroxymethyldihydropteridine diphosphokinase [Candidatus Zixiibacteriota bacterium]